MGPVQDPHQQYVPWYIYERDMNSIQEKLDLLLESNSVSKGAQEERKEQKATRWKIGLVAITAFLSIVGNFVINLFDKL